MAATKFVALGYYSTFPAGETVAHKTFHRSQAAAARALSKAISNARAPGPGWNGRFAVVTPSDAVLSLRQAQGKMPGGCDWPNMVKDAIRLARA